MADRRILQQGDRAAIYEAEMYGEVVEADEASVTLRTDEGYLFTVPAVLVSWVPSIDEPDLVVDGCYRNADEPNDARRFWYFPESTTDRPWIEPWEHGEKNGNHYRTRDELPRRIEVDR